MSSLPKVTFMHATDVTKPFHRDGWVYEEKYDGWRAIAYKDGSAVRLMSRNSKDLTGASLKSLRQSGRCRLAR